MPLMQEREQMRRTPTMLGIGARILIWQWII